MKKIDIFYAVLKAKKFERLNDFYYYCIDYANDGVALDIGSDNFLGLTKKLLEKQWSEEICAFDLQDSDERNLKDYMLSKIASSEKKYVLSEVNEFKNKKIEFYVGDISENISFFKNKRKNISILEIDLKQSTKFKLDEVLNLFNEYLSDNVVIIINEFTNDIWDNINPDGYFLADFFENSNKSYECLGYLPYNINDDGELLGNEGATAWVVSDGKNLQGNDLKNLINQLWTHSPCSRCQSLAQCNQERLKTK